MRKGATDGGVLAHLESFSFSALRRLASCAFSAIHLVTSSWFSSEVFLSFSSKAVKVICRASYSSFRVWLALSRSCSLLRSSWHSVSRSEMVCRHSAILQARHTAGVVPHASPAPRPGRLAEGSTCRSSGTDSGLGRYTGHHREASRLSHVSRQAQPQCSWDDPLGEEAPRENFI